jgi:hypothetical protein
LGISLNTPNTQVDSTRLIDNALCTGDASGSAFQQSSNSTTALVNIAGPAALYGPTKKLNGSWTQIGDEEMDVDPIQQWLDSPEMWEAATLRLPIGTRITHIALQKLSPSRDEGLTQPESFRIEDSTIDAYMSIVRLALKRNVFISPCIVAPMDEKIPFSFPGFHNVSGLS